MLSVGFFLRTRHALFDLIVISVLSMRKCRYLRDPIFIFSSRSLNHVVFSMVFIGLSRSCDVYRVSSWLCIAVEALCGTVCATSAIAFCAKGEKSHYVCLCLWLYGNYSWCRLGGNKIKWWRERREPRANGVRLKMADASHVFTYLTARVCVDDHPTSIARIKVRTVVLASQNQTCWQTKYL